MYEQIQQPRQTSHQRLERWADELESSCGTFHPNLPRSFDRQTFLGEVRPVAPQAGHASAEVVTNCPQVYRRLQDIRVDGQDFFYLVLQQQGNARIEQADQIVQLKPGDLTLLDVSKPSDFRHPGVSRQLSIILPRRLMNDVVRGQPIQTGVKISGESRLAALVRHFVDGAFGPPLEDLDEETVLESLATLLKPVATQKWGAFGEQPSELIRKALRFIEANLDQGRLTAGEVSRELCVSERTLHRAFARLGHTFGSYVLERRLERSAQSLVRQQGMPIALIADLAGFGDISHFSRTFKRRFGVSPRAYRGLHG